MAQDNFARILGMGAGNGGGEGTDNYNDLSNKPKVNGVELVGDKSSKQLNIKDIPSGNTIPSGTTTGEWFYLLVDVGNVVAGLYRYNGSLWELKADLSKAIIIQAESHTTIETYAVPVLTSDQVELAYNGVVAGNNVFVVDDMDFITIQVLDASSIDSENISVRLLFTDKMVLTYYQDGTIDYQMLGGSTFEKYTWETDLSNGDVIFESTIKTL